MSGGTTVARRVWVLSSAVIILVSAIAFLAAIGMLYSGIWGDGRWFISGVVTALVSAGSIHLVVWLDDMITRATQEGDAK